MTQTDRPITIDDLIVEQEGYFQTLTQREKEVFTKGFQFSQAVTLLAISKRRGVSAMMPKGVR